MSVSQAAAFELAQRLHSVVHDRAQMLLDEARRDDSPSPSPRGTNELNEALAMLTACTQLTADLQQTADFAADRALRNKATFAEIGAACGISRQAARQGHRKKLADREAQRAAFQARRAEDDDPYAADPYADDRYDLQSWPPRSWRFRAPNGTRTVRLVGGPAEAHTVRVPTGDDVFQYLDHTTAFGRHPRYARYTASTPNSEEYQFTSEYWIRWSPF